VRLYEKILLKQMPLRNKLVIRFKNDNLTTTYKKSNEEQKTFIDDLLLVVVKGLLLLKTIENI
jgi:hypothetical protein